MPLVSVTIPTYNRANLVARAIESVRRQTIGDWECLVVDDGSTDTTAEVIRAFGDDRIRYLRHETNRGVACARNTGIRAARGEYLAFLDSDDEWLPTKLERQLPLFESSRVNPGVTYTAAYRVNSVTGTRTINCPRLRGDVFETMLFRQHINLTTVVVKTAVLRAIGGFDEQLPRGEDRDLFIRLSALTMFDGLPEPLANHYFHGGPHVNNGDPTTGVAYKRRLIEKLKAMPRVSRAALAYQHRSLGLLLLRGRRHREAVIQMLASIQYAPVDPRPYLGLARVGASWAIASSRRRSTPAPNKRPLT